LAIDQVQLAREQIVDEAAVAPTGGRQAYLTALAAPFLRRHHILRRVEAISARRRVSVWRVAACGIGLVMTTAMATAGATSLLPLQQDVVYSQKDGVTLPIPIRQVRPGYPEDTKAERIEGMVLLECVVTPNGNVSQLNVERKLDPRLDAAATAALEEWRFTRAFWRRSATEPRGLPAKAPQNESP
jgi:TonB family protein